MSDQKKLIHVSLVRLSPKLHYKIFSSSEQDALLLLGPYIAELYGPVHVKVNKQK